MSVSRAMFGSEPAPSPKELTEANETRKLCAENAWEQLVSNIQHATKQGFSRVFIPVSWFRHREHFTTDELFDRLIALGYNIDIVMRRSERYLKVSW